MNIAIDFDNTISITAYDDNGKSHIVGYRPGAKEYIQKLHEDGHYIILWTCREGWNLAEAENFCHDNNIYYDVVNANPPDHMKKWKHDSRKICCDVYIDDAGILGIPSWEEIYEIISNKSQK